MHEQVLYGPLLRRVVEEVRYVERGHHTRLSLFVVFAVYDEVQSGPPLEQEEGKCGWPFLDLAPENAQQIGLHALSPYFKVQTLLLLLKVVHLHHHGLDLLIELEVREVDLLDWTWCLLFLVSRPESDKICVYI